MDVPENLKFTREHEWVKDMGDGMFRMGITHFAQDALGDIVYFEAPADGMEVEQGVEFCVVESVKAVSDIYAPLTGTIAEVNDAVVDSPELVNEHPYGEGWLVAIESSVPSEIDDLMTADEYTEFLESEG